MTQEVDLRYAKATLLRFYHQAVLFQSIEQECKVLNMLSFGFAGNQNVIQVYEDKLQICAHRVHETLERLGRVLEPHWHSQKLEKAERRDDSCFGDVIWMDRDLVVSLHKIYLRKYNFPSQVRSEVMDSRYWVTVKLGTFVQSPEVTAWSPLSIGFRNHV